MLLALLLAAVLLAALLLWAIWRSLTVQPPIKDSSTDRDSLIDPLWPDFALSGFSSPGSMSMSLTFRGLVYRYQAKKHLYQGRDFLKMFEDGPWKWEAQQRFAGANKNPGHFFAFDLEGARREIFHYVDPQDLNEYAVLSIELVADNLLDLTNLANVETCCSEMKIYGWGIEKLNEMLTSRTGGDETTNMLGYWAHRRGYSGAIFFSSRQLSDADRASIDPSKRWDDGFAYMDYEFLRGNASNLCLVIFSGAKLLASIVGYGIGNEPKLENPYRGTSEMDLLQMFQFSDDFQEFKSRSFNIFRDSHSTD